MTEEASDPGPRSDPSRFVIGWEEWVALPDLALPAIKAKVDTGAKTSALHAFLIEPFGPASAPMVRFGIHPVPGRDDIEVFATAPIVDRREVTSSNGDRETRYVIRTRVRMGPREWEIEATLTNRESMAYRMLLGRQAIRDDMWVEPAASFLQARLSYKAYRRRSRRRPAARPLRIALVTHSASTPSARRLTAAALARNHEIEPLELDGLRIALLSLRAQLTRGGASIGPFDAVVALVRRRDAAFAATVVRHLEATGATALTTSDALARTVDGFAIAQRLVEAGVRVGMQTRTAADAVDASMPSADTARDMSILVVGGRPLAGHHWIAGHPRRAASAVVELSRSVAIQTAAATGLGLVAIDLSGPPDAPEVIGISTAPALARFSRLSRTDVAAAIVAELEGRARLGTPRTAVTD